MSCRMIALSMMLALGGVVHSPASAQSGPTPRDLRDIPREKLKTIPLPGQSDSEREKESAPVVRKLDQTVPSVSRQDILSDHLSDASETSTSSTDKNTPSVQATTTIIRPKGEPRYSAVSGTVSGNTRIIDEKDAFISGILWKEKNNKPCNIRFWTLDHIFGEAAWEPCTGYGAAAVFDTGHEVRLEKGTAIGRIQVCESGGSKRIKGIKVYGDRINADGSTTYHPAIAKDDLANCRTWKQDVLCPTGTLSTGIVVHYEEGNTPAATGLQLVCRAVGTETVVTESEKTPVSFQPLEIKPVLKPAIIANASSDKSDKGNEVMETTPTLTLAAGAPEFTAISGRQGQETYTFEFGTRALSRIDWSEKSDKACRLTLSSLGKGRDTSVRIIEQCSRGVSYACENETCSGNNWLGGEHTVNIVGQHPAITALGVCTNGKSNGRVKGLEVRGGEILNRGTMSSVTDVSRDRLSHCRDWKALVLCSSGSVATGVRAHFDPGKGAGKKVAQLVGMQLACRRIE